MNSTGTFSLLSMEAETEQHYRSLTDGYDRDIETMMDKAAEFAGIHARLSQMKGAAEEILMVKRGQTVEILKSTRDKITAKELELKTDEICAHEEKVCTDIEMCIKTCQENITVLITLISYEKNEMNYAQRIQQA